MNMVKMTILGTRKVLRLFKAKRFKKPFTLADLPPWAKERGKHFSKAQQKVVSNFTKIAHSPESKGIPLAQRNYLIGKTLALPPGVHYPETVKPAHVPFTSVSEDELKRRLAALKAMVGVPA